MNQYQMIVGYLTALAGRFREGWERAGRPRAGNLTRGRHPCRARIPPLNPGNQ